MWLKTREIAWKKIENIRNVDLSKPKTSNSPPSYEEVEKLELEDTMSTEWWQMRGYYTPKK